jgi:hypothetical protein
MAREKNVSPDIGPGRLQRAAEVGIAKLLLDEFAKRPTHVRAAQVFLAVARAGRLGVPQGALEKQTGIQRAAISRWCITLGEGRPSAGEPGMGLIAQHKTDDLRANEWALTSAGSELWERIKRSVR